MQDLFETPHLIPAAVQAELDAHAARVVSKDTYAALSILRFRLERLGYTIDWGLDAEPYGLCAFTWLPQMQLMQQLFCEVEPDAEGCGFYTQDAESGYIGWDEFDPHSTSADIIKAATWISCCGDELGDTRVCPTCLEHC
jgi:hypothetical protein